VSRSWLALLVITCLALPRGRSDSPQGGAARGCSHSSRSSPRVPARHCGRRAALGRRPCSSFGGAAGHAGRPPASHLPVFPHILCIDGCALSYPAEILLPGNRWCSRMVIRASSCVAARSVLPVDARGVSNPIHTPGGIWRSFAACVGAQPPRGHALHGHAAAAACCGRGHGATLRTVGDWRQGCTIRPYACFSPVFRIYGIRWKCERWKCGRCKTHNTTPNRVLKGSTLFYS
jgi:hypothetical protein